MKRRENNNPATARRRGAMLPAIAFSLLVVATASALVMNKLWIDAVEVELQRVAEATALAAAGSYVNDDLLKSDFETETAVLEAKELAVEVARENPVAGQPISLKIEGDQTDIVFGRRVPNGIGEETTFLLTHDNPNVVEVRARRGREMGNPITLFYPGVTGRAHTDAQVIVEATFTNRIDHFVAAPDRLVPALPLAILEHDPTGTIQQTWSRAIVGREGADEYCFDEEIKAVLKRSDGIPEIRLRSAPLKTDPLQSNLQVLDFANNLDELAITEQIHHGLKQQALSGWQNRLSATQVLDLTGMANVTTPLQDALHAQVGQKRLCLLYQEAGTLGVDGWTTPTCCGVVAIRIMKVIPEAGEAVTLIVQPTVMTTRTAVPSEFANTENENSERRAFQPEESEEVDPNPYVYRLYLSR